MSKYRREGHRDTMHAPVVKVFAQCGYLVCDLAGVGHGCPDLLVFAPGVGCRLIEVKTPSPSRPMGESTPDQLRFVAQGWPVTMIVSEHDAERMALEWRREARG